MRFSTNKILSVTVLMITLAVSLILFISSRQSRQLQDTEKLISHTHEVIIKIQNIVLAQDDKETNFRRYLITGNAEFLKFQEQSDREVKEGLATIKNLTSDNKVQQAFCDSMSEYINKRDEYSSRMITLRRDKGLEAVSGLMSTKEGKINSDMIRRIGVMMQNEEYRLLEIRKSNNARDFSKMNFILYGTLFSGFILGIVIILIIRSNSNRQKLNEEKFSALLNAAPDATVIVNEKGLIHLINQQTENLFNYKREELIGKPVEILIPGELRNKHEHHRRDFTKSPRVRTMGAGIELKAVKKNGVMFPVEISLSPIVTKEGMLVSASIRDITLRKLEEEKLKIAKKDFQLLVSSVKDYAIFLLDKNGCVASWNTGAEQIKGYKAEEIIGKPIDVFYTEEEKRNGEPERNLQITLLHGHYETEGVRVKKDGSTFIANVVFTALVDEEGKHYGYAKVTRDISEKRKAEENMRFLASIADNIQDPVISTDNDTAITRWNKAAENLLEWKSEEVIGKTTLEVLKTSYQSETRNDILGHLKEKGFWHGEVIYHTRSGKPVNVLATASNLKDSTGNIIGNIILAKDITDRIKAEVKLKEFEHFFNNSNDLSCIANAEGYFENVNPSFEKILGYSKNELSEDPFLDFVHPDDIPATLEAYEQLKSGATLIHFVNRYRRKDGNYLWFDWNATPNPVTGKFYCIARDFTARKKAEDALKRSNEELEAFSYSVSHDLRAPLRAIVGFTAILEEDYSNKLDDEARRITDVIKNNTLKMGNLIDDLLTFSRMGRQDIVKSKIDTEALVKEIITSLDTKNNGHTISWDIKPMQETFGDINTMKQVWINLISNAIKYTGNTANPHIEIGSYPDGEKIVFFINDNGVGFDQKYSAKLFKVFQRLHSGDEFEGTGIGLAIVEKIITKHGGNVWAEAEINKGASFYFSLPVC